MSGGLGDNIATGFVGEAIFGSNEKALKFLDPADIWGGRARIEERKARQADERRTQLEQMRAAVESVRQAIIQRAEVAALGETVGIGGSSALSGALGSIQSQAGSNLLFQQQQEELRQLASSRIQEAVNKQAAARNIQLFGQIAFTAANAANWGNDRIEGVSTIDEADQALIEVGHQEQFSRTV